jgi:hypothetical protein
MVAAVQAWYINRRRRRARVAGTAAGTTSLDFSDSESSQYLALFEDI